MKPMAVDGSKPFTDLAARARGLPEGPPGLPLIGCAYSMIRDPLGFLTEVAREYGDVVRLKLPRQSIYLLNHPDAIEAALRTENEHLAKDMFTRELSAIVGKGLLTSEGAFWRQQRRLAQPAFHHQRVRAYAEIMVRQAERTVSRFEVGQVRDVHKDMMRLTLDIVAETLFGTDVGLVAKQIESALDVFMERFSGIRIYVPLSLPLPRNLRFHRAVRQLDQIVYTMIRERRGRSDTGDLLSMLLRATTEEGGTMSDRQLRDEVVTLLLAGHETTALALSFALYLLDRHPEVEAKLVRELEQVLGERPPGIDDLRRLTYADAVIRETLRLYPPAWAIGREVTARCRIAGHDVEPKTQLWMAQWVVHRDARYFANPERFEPERWSEEFAKQLPRFAYFPFGGGPRVCIGNSFAMLEAVLLLTTIVQRVRLRLVDERPLRLQPSVTLRPKDGVRVRVEARSERTARLA
jgi:cytochrome P450